MTEFTDKHGFKRSIEFSKSEIHKDWVNMTIYTPQKQIAGSCWSIPQDKIQDLINNLEKVKCQLNTH
jgi:hypothetical protein